MPDANALHEYYRTLTDDELLNLKREGGFTNEAEEILESELAHRKLTSSDLKRYIAVSERSKLRDEVRERGGSYKSLGLQFFGKLYLTEDDRKNNIQLRTKWFTVSGIPLIPIASYRFSCKGNSGQQRVIDRVPLNWGQVFITWIKTAILIAVVVLAMCGYYWYSQHRKH